MPMISLSVGNLTKKFVRCIAVTFVEILVEPILWACFLGVLSAPRGEGLLMAGAAMIGLPICLFVYSYHLTRLVAGAGIRMVAPWLYPIAASALFVGHLYVMWYDSKSQVTDVVREMAVPFMIGGTLIVFACSIMGNKLLTRWALHDRIALVPE